MTSKDGLDENEGEGSPTAARAYRKGVEEYVKTHDPEKIAAEAARKKKLAEDETRKLEGAPVAAAKSDKDCTSESCAASAPLSGGL